MPLKFEFEPRLGNLLCHWLGKNLLQVLVNRAGIHKMLVRIANREDPDQTASEEAV